MNELAVKVVTLEGDHHEFGKKQGEEIRNTPLLEQLKLLAALNENPNLEKAEKLLRKFSPQLLEEITGLGESLGLEKELAMRFSGYDVIFPKMGCTTLVTDGAYIRNYDFSPLLYDARLVVTKPRKGYATIGFSQQIIGRLDGMSEKGLVVGLHFVNNEERAEGFFATTIVRMLLEQCADVEEAIRLITSIPHGYCYNYSITDRSGKSIIVEASPEKQNIIEETPLLCTNHFESETLKNRNRNDIQLQGSINRKNYLRSLLQTTKSIPEYFDVFNDGVSPLFSHRYNEFFGTLHTVVYVPEKLKVMLGVGRDCPPVEFSLPNVLDGKTTLPPIIKGKIEKHISL